MKKTILFLLVSLTMLCTHADWVIDESFEGTFPPNGWLLNPTSGVGAWVQNPGTSHGPGSAYDGDYAIMFDNYAYQVGNSGSFVTEQFDISSYENPVLNFYWWNNDFLGAPEAVLHILTSFDGTNFVEIYSFNTVQSQSWQNQEIPISNATVKIKFTADSDFGLYNTYIDKIRIGTNVNHDIGITSISYPGGNLFAGDSIPISIHFYNYGALSFQTSITLLIDDDFYTSQITNSINPNASSEVILNWEAAAGEHIISVVLGDDDYALNNTAQETIYIFSENAFIQGFEGEQFPPTDWNVEPNTWVAGPYPSSAYEGQGYANLYLYTTYVDKKLITPLLAINSSSSISFVAKTAWGTTQSIKIMYSSDKINWTQVGTTIPMTTNYTEYNVGLAPLAGNNYYLAFAGSGNSYNSIYLDNVLGPDKAVEELDVPGNLQIVIEDDTVKITWDEVLGANSYRVEECDAPDGIFTEAEGTFNGEEWTTPANNSKNFYRVIAQ
jgi:hypothetical protein